jgi:excisionase family DNA binding protein
MAAGALRVEKSSSQSSQSSQRSSISARAPRPYAAPQVGARAAIVVPAVREVVREVMDMRQAALYLGISTDSLYRYAAESLVPGFRLGNRWRFKKSCLDQWMEQQSDPHSSRKTVRATQKKPVRSAR